MICCPHPQQSADSPVGARLVVVDFLGQRKARCGRRVVGHPVTGEVDPPAGAASVVPVGAPIQATVQVEHWNRPKGASFAVRSHPVTAVRSLWVPEAQPPLLTWGLVVGIGRRGSMTHGCADAVSDVLTGSGPVRVAGPIAGVEECRDSRVDPGYLASLRWHADPVQTPLDLQTAGPRWLDAGGGFFGGFDSTGHAFCTRGKYDGVRFAKDPLQGGCPDGFHMAFEYLKGIVCAPNVPNP